MTESREQVTCLPYAEKVEGLYFNPNTGNVQIQYRSDNKIYEISMSLAEVLKMEEWFIKMRQQVGATMRQTNTVTPPTG